MQCFVLNFKLQRKTHFCTTLFFYVLEELPSQHAKGVFFCLVFLTVGDAHSLYSGSNNTSQLTRMQNNQIRSTKRERTHVILPVVNNQPRPGIQHLTSQLLLLPNWMCEFLLKQ